jgi:hypothetical protein
MRTIAIFLLMTTASAAATDCRSDAPTAPREPWSWRLIDGRKCWYQGLPKRDKSTLRWPAEHKPEPRPEPVPAIGPPVLLPSERDLMEEYELRFEDRWKGKPQ